MTESDLVAALQPVTNALEALGVPYYVGGSLASSAHGIARASLNADIVAALKSEHTDPFARRLESAYYIPMDRLAQAVTARSACNFIHLDTMFKIDLFVSKGRPFDQRAIERARPQPIDDRPDTPHIHIASAEDVVLAKLEWFRLGGETSERQWWDIVGVLRVTDGADRVYLRHWATSLGVEDLLERALIDAAS
jgi:hypothetical protein